MNWMKILCRRLSYSIHQKCAPCAHSPRTHRALTAHSKNGVMWPRGPWSSISSMRPWEHLVHGFRVSFYTLWEDARSQNWSPGSASIQRFYSDLHGLRGCQATELTPCKCPHSMFLLRFTHFERMLGDTIESLRVPPSMFILCLRFESIPGNKIHSLGMPSFNVSIAFHMLWEGAVAENWFPGSGHIQCFYCSCFERILGNKADSLWVPTFYFIVFYMFWEDAGVTKLIPWECPHATFLLRFTRFERRPGNKGASLGVPTFNVSIACYMLWGFAM